MATGVVEQIRKAIWRKFFADEKIRTVLEGVRGEILISIDSKALLVGSPKSPIFSYCSIGSS